MKPPDPEWEARRVTHDRIPNRAARLKALGNAVVPQQIYPVLAATPLRWDAWHDRMWFPKWVVGPG